MIQSKYYNYSRIQFVDLYKENAPSASPSTVSTFDTALKRLEKIYGNTIENMKLHFIDDPDKLITKFNNTEYSKNTLYSTINMINKLIIMIDAPLSLKNQWSNSVKKLTTERDNHQLDNTKNKNESDNWIDYDELLEKVNEKYDSVISNLDTIKKNNFRNFMILCLYIYMPPARIGNYLNCKVIRGDTNHDLPTTHNYIIIKNLDSTNPLFYFIFNKYKTSKHLGTQLFKVSDDKLINLLDIYFTLFNTSNDFFLNTKMTELSQPNVTNILKAESKALVDKSLSVDLLRHIYITYFLKQNPTLRDKLDLAGCMGQGFQCNQQDIYNRI